MVLPSLKSDDSPPISEDIKWQPGTCNGVERIVPVLVIIIGKADNDLGVELVDLVDFIDFQN